MPLTLERTRRLRPWMAWLGLLVPAVLTWFWASGEPKVRAEKTVAETLTAAQSRTQALEDRFNSFRRLVADLAEEPAMAGALLGAQPGTSPAAARQLNLVAKASGAAIDRIELFDSGGALRLGWEYDHVLDDYRSIKPQENPRLDLPYVQTSLRSPKGATWVGASEPEGAENLVLKPDAPVVPSAYIAVPVYGPDPSPRGLLALKARLDSDDFLGPANREPWMILGENGQIIFRPSAAASWVRYLPSARRLQSFEEAFGRTPKDLSALSGALAVKYGLVCYRRIHLDHRRDWILLHPYSKEGLFALSQETLIRIGVLWVLSLLLLGTTWWALQRRELAQDRDAQNQLLHATLNASRDLAIFTTGPDGTIRLFSAGAERMLGFAAEEAIGRFTLKDFHVPEELPEAAHAFSSSGEHVSQSLESVSLHRSGGRRTWTYRDVADRHFPVFLSITAMHGRSGEILGHVVVAQDARPALEREGKLEDAATKARAAEQLKNTFLAVMSHEVRTPMNAIMGMVRVLKRTELSPEQSEITMVGERAAKNLLELLDSVLDYTKLEAGRMELQSTPFPPYAITQECAALWQLQAASKGLQLEFEAPQMVPLALGDPARLRQVLNNLLGNAVKFTESGWVRLHLDAQPGANGLKLRWEIEDTGPGIAPEDLERIFEPFTQGEKGTTRHYGGTGIGLALCRELANHMGGTLTVQSRPGGGSMFILKLELPRAEDNNL